MTPRIETLDEDESPDELFKKFVGRCVTAECFVAIVSDDEMTHAAMAYRRDQAIHLAYRLRKMARQIEADYDSAPDL